MGLSVLFLADAGLAVNARQAPAVSSGPSRRAAQLRRHGVNTVGVSGGRCQVLGARPHAHKLLPGRTTVQQRAALAQRPLSVANTPAVLDQRDVEWVDLIRREHRFEDIVSLRRPGLRWHQAQALADAMHVCINRQRRPAQRKHQHACRGLRSYPFQLAEPGLRFLECGLAQKLEIKTTAPFVDGLQRRLDARRLDCRQTACLYLLYDLLRLRGQQVLPLPEPRPQPHKGAPGVGVRRILREYREYQLRHSIALRDSAPTPPSPAAIAVSRRAMSRALVGSSWLALSVLPNPKEASVWSMRAGSTVSCSSAAVGVSLMIVIARTASWTVTWSFSSISRTSSVFRSRSMYFFSSVSRLPKSSWPASRCRKASSSTSSL